MSAAPRKVSVLVIGRSIRVLMAWWSSTKKLSPFCASRKVKIMKIVNCDKRHPRGEYDDTFNSSSVCQRNYFLLCRSRIHFHLLSLKSRAYRNRALSRNNFFLLFVIQFLNENQKFTRNNVIFFIINNNSCINAQHVVKLYINQLMNI